MGRGGGVLKHIVSVKIIDSGILWGLNPSEWIQLVSVVIAMLAAIFSYMTIRQQRKQFQLERQREDVKFIPRFRINQFNNTNENEIFFDLVNEGFAYFADEKVNWIGTEDITVDFFNGQVGNDKEGKHDSLVLLMKINKYKQQKGYFQIEGRDIFNNKKSFKSPEIIFDDKGKIENHIKIFHQYLI